MSAKLTWSLRTAVALSLFTFSVAVWAQEPPANPPDAQTQNPAAAPTAKDQPRDPGNPAVPDQPAAPSTVDQPANPPAPPPPAPPAADQPPAAPAAPAAAQPSTPGWHKFSPQPEPVAPNAPPAAPAAPRAVYAPVPVPPQITLPAGTYLTVRVDQYLSSDKNKNGDAFSATISRPLVAKGLIIARPGATVGGHVVDAKKAGRVSGVSHLQIALNTITLADGEQVPVESALDSIKGNTSNGRDAAAIATTTATGAAIGAAADWGTGAAIGSGAGLAAGVVGVLLTRGRPTVIYPESQLTFRLAKPVTFSTEKAPQAFADARTLNVQRANSQRPPAPPSLRYGSGPYGPPPPYYYYPPYWGPSFGVVFGGGYRGYYGYRYGFRR